VLNRTRSGGDCGSEVDFVPAYRNSGKFLCFLGSSGAVECRLFQNLFNGAPYSFNKFLRKQFILLIGDPLPPVNKMPVTRSGIYLNLSRRMNIRNERIINFIDHFPVQVRRFNLSLIPEFLIPEPDDELLFHPINLLNITVKPAHHSHRW